MHALVFFRLEERSTNYLSACLNAHGHLFFPLCSYYFFRVQMFLISVFVIRKQNDFRSFRFMSAANALFHPHLFSLSQFFVTWFYVPMFQGRHLTLKLKMDTFENRSRSQSLPDYTNESEVIATFGIELLREEMANERSRHHVPMASTSQHQTSDIKSNKPLTLRLMGKLPLLSISVWLFRMVVFCLFPVYFMKILAS